MKNTLQAIDSLFKELASLTPMSEQAKRDLSKKFRLEFNYNSNHIEGNTLTYGQTELLLIFEKTDGAHDKRELDEMAGHDVAYKLIQEWALDKEYKITERDLRELNEIILVRPFWKEARTHDGQNTRRRISVGTYKEYPNSVLLQNGEMFDYASPTDTPILMEALFQWLHQEMEQNTIHPVELAALLHYKFVCIHPFDDGNGRLSRLLMNYVLLYYGFPPVIIKSADKKNYLMALNRADTGNIDAFVEYIIEQLIWSLELLEKAHKGLSLIEPDDLDKELELLNRRLKRNEPVLTVSGDKNAVDNIIKENIFVLADYVNEKLKSLKLQFMRSATDIELSVSGSTFLKKLSLEESTNEIINEYNEILPSIENIQSIKITHNLIGFKKTVEARNFYISLKINFNNFNYTISGANRTTKSYPYGKKLNESEIKEIAAPFIRQLIEEIGNEVDKNV